MVYFCKFHYFFFFFFVFIKGFLPTFFFIFHGLFFHIVLFIYLLSFYYFFANLLFCQCIFKFLLFFPLLHIHLLAFVLIILRESVVLSLYLQIAALVSSFGPAFFLRLVILELQFAFLLTCTPLNRLPSSFEYSLYMILISLFSTAFVTFLYCFFNVLRYFPNEIIVLGYIVPSTRKNASLITSKSV